MNYVREMFRKTSHSETIVLLPQMYIFGVATVNLDNCQRCPMLWSVDCSKVELYQISYITFMYYNIMWKYVL